MFPHEKRRADFSDCCHRLLGPPDIYPHTFAEPQLNLTEVFKKPDSMTYFVAGPTLVNITGLT